MRADVEAGRDVPSKKSQAVSEWRNDKLGLDPGMADWVLDQIRTASRETSLEITRQTNVSSGKKTPTVDQLPMVSVKFIGGYTDDFDKTNGLSGPFQQSGGTADLDMTADGYLTLEESAGYVMYSGKVGGGFLPIDSAWDVTVNVTEMQAQNGATAGLVIYNGDLANNITWGTTSFDYLWVWRLSAASTRIQSRAAWVDLGAVMPSRATPLILKLHHSADGYHTCFYKVGTADSWHEVGTAVLRSANWANPIDCGPLFKSGSASTQTCEFDKIVVDYTPTSNNNEEAFIPTTTFGVYKEDYLYIYQSDNSYREIEPLEGMVVEWYGLLYTYDGSDWVQLYAPPSTHSLRHEDGGDDEIDVTGLSGLLADEQDPLDHAADHENGGGDEISVADLSGLLADPQTALQHPLSNITFHSGVVGAVSGNIALLDANGLPGDAGTNVAALTASLALEVKKLKILLSTLNISNIPGAYTHRVFTQATKPTVLQMGTDEWAKWVDSDDDTRYIVICDGTVVDAVEVTT